MPTALAITNPARSNIPNIIMSNSGSQRFDVYAGTFTINDNYVVSPFDDLFVYVNVPYSVGSQVLSVLNSEGASGRKRALSSDDLAFKRFRRDKAFEPRSRRLFGSLGAPETDEEYGRGVVDGRYNAWLKRQWEERDRVLLARAEAEAAAAGTALTLGYVTQDSCPGVGDDTPHTAIPFFDSPDYISSPLPTGLQATDQMDVVFLDFFESQILSIVNSLQTAKTFTTDDVLPYGNAATNTVYGIFAEAKWK